VTGRPLMHGDATASWWPGGRRRGIVCALRGHRWQSQPTASGVVAVLCGRCSELVIVPFVDVPEVLGLPAAQEDAWLGSAAATYLAVDLAAAHVRRDESGWVRLRREATGRPGDSVDSLAQLAAMLSWTVDPQRPLRALHQVADGVERSALERELRGSSRHPGGDA
jgi:hypothetical protein